MFKLKITDEVKERLTALCEEGNGEYVAGLILAQMKWYKNSRKSAEKRKAK